MTLRSLSELCVYSLVDIVTGQVVTDEHFHLGLRLVPVRIDQFGLDRFVE
jgi:hypothetical protein